MEKKKTKEKMTDELTKWNFQLYIDKDPRRMDRGWRIFNFSIFRWKELPDAGEMIQSKHYTGFRLIFAFFFPIERY